MINLDEDMFLNASEAAQFLGIARVTFYKNYLKVLQAFRIGEGRRRHYRRSDLVPLRTAKPVVQFREAS